MSLLTLALCVCVTYVAASGGGTPAPPPILADCEARFIKNTTARYFSLLAENSNYALDVIHGQLTAPAPVQLWNNWKGANQIWYMEKYNSTVVVIRTLHSCKCLANAQTGIRLEKCDTSARQQWRVISTSSVNYCQQGYCDDEIECKYGGLLSPPILEVKPAYTLSGKLVSVFDGKCLGVAGVPRNAAPIHNYPCSNPGTSWVMVPA